MDSLFQVIQCYEKYNVGRWMKNIHADECSFLIACIRVVL